MMAKLAVKAALLFIVFVLQGCAVKNEWSDAVTVDVYKVAAKQSLFSTRPKLPTAEDLLRLDYEIERDFHVFFNRPDLGSYSEIEKVSTYLGMLVDDFTYSDETYTAQQAIDNKSGNCLSLTLVTAAIAKLAGVKVTFDLLDHDPIYTLEPNVLISSEHMRAVLKADFKSSSTIEQNPQSKRIIIDYFNTQGLKFVSNVSQAYQTSLYYSNKAAQYLIDENLAHAYFFAKQAVNIYSVNPSALNTLAIVHRKMGDIEGAESVLKSAIVEKVNHAPLFYRSYIALLEKQDRAQDLAVLKKQYELLNDKNPLQWVRAGIRAHSRGEYVAATSHYERALDIAPDMHQINLLIARSKIAAGNTRGARSHILNAINLDPTEGVASVYKGKLVKLKRL